MELTRERVIQILKTSGGMRGKVATEVLSGLLANPALMTSVYQRSKPEHVAGRYADLALQHADELILQLAQPIEERYAEPKPEIVL